MEPVRIVEGIVAPLDRSDVDTDQIIPKQFLKRIERTGYGQFLFHDWRTRDDGTPDPSFVLNQPPYDRARILVAGRNFGCGSSREHAVWALQDFGFGAVIAPSFADIFLTNCHQVGIVPVTLTEERVGELLARATAEPGYTARVDVDTGRVTDDRGFQAPFSMDPFRRRCFLEGLDDIALTLEHEDELAAFERRHGVFLDGQLTSGTRRY
jgi:3-isopropylmalate/(R)-2-methylmalate dehydratase small subunit